MSNRERVRRHKTLRNTACGIGSRLPKLRLNKLAKADFPSARAVPLALDEDEVRENGPLVLSGIGLLRHRKR